MFKNSKKISLILILAIIVFLSTTATLYLYILPKFLTTPQFIYFVKNFVQQNCGAELVITNPDLKTHFQPYISLKVDSMILTKDTDVLLNLQNFDTDINLSKLHSKKIILQKLGADEIFIDINKLQTLTFKKNEKKKNKKQTFKIDCFNTLFYVKKCAILYKTQNNVDIKFLAKDLEISDGREPKFLHFGIFLDLYHNNQHLKLFFKERNNVFFKDRKLQAHNFKFKVNNSEVTLNAQLTENNNYDITFESDKFEIDNIVKFLNTNLMIPNGDQYTSCFKNLLGDFNFKINLNNNGINGVINVNKIISQLIPVSDLPLTIQKGQININPYDISLKNFQGFYGKSKNNILTLDGAIKDYTHSAKTEIFIKGFMYEELATYISKLSGIKINIIKGIASVVQVNCNSTGKVGITGKFGIKPGNDILFEGTSISPKNYYREIDIDFSILKNIFSINKLNYYISDTIFNKTSIPLIEMNGNMDISTGILNELGFNVPQPLPSEFFNVLTNQNIFKYGTFAGKLKYTNGKTPRLDGFMTLKDTMVVGQFIIIKDMTLKTTQNIVNIIAEGMIRRAKYKIDANILNNLLFPIIVQDVNVNFDNLDVENIMKTFAPRPANRPKRQPQAKQIKIAKSNVSTKYFEVTPTQKQKETNNDVHVTFQPNLIEIKKCMFNVKKGQYKEINFGDLHANLTLTRNGILEIKSNKFNFADGISTLKVYCDLLKEKYSIRLGAKDVDTDAISTSVLNLSKEISGKASALLEFYTDSSTKLNGKIQFKVVNGTIAKLGLVQYILNVASIFRNPIAMVTPSTIFDIVNIPEGTFKQINGVLDIKNNSVERMMIKSSSPQLSSFIIGRINLENMDASLRIYTKFNSQHKGAAGFVRDLSLNNLAQKATAYKKDTVSYYDSELKHLPPLETGEDTAQVFLTTFDGDIQSSNFISSLKKIK